MLKQSRVHVKSHPAGLEAAAISVADGKPGETIKAFVVANADLHVVELKSHCQAELAAYKVPRDCKLRRTLPRLNVGKILRRELREP